MTQPASSFSATQWIYLAKSCMIENSQCEHTYGNKPVKASLEVYTEKTCLDNTPQENTFDANISLFVTRYLDEQNKLTRVQSVDLQNKTLPEVAQLFCTEDKTVSFLFCNTCKTFLVLQNLRSFETQ